MWDDEAGGATGIQDLTRPEHLLVWAMRAIALGHEDCPVVIRAFRSACGPNGDHALQAYCVFVKYVAMSARERPKVHAPGCPCVGEDEAAMVSVIAAAQQSLTDTDESPLRAALGRVTGRAPDEHLLLVAQSMGRLLQASGHRLPLRGGATVAPARTLH